MYPIVHEKEILSKEAPQGGVWTEDNIRRYQESHGINYSLAVFVRNEKPNRIWSNDRYFGEQVRQENPPLEVSKDEVQSLKEQIVELQRKLLESANNGDPEDVVHTGVERHGLHPSEMDHRTKQYKDWKRDSESA